VPVAIKLTHDEPRLAFLALTYHLGRPGSELDAATLQPTEHGLREMKVQLGRDLAATEAILELDDAQYRKLLSAMYGAVNELRVHHMRGGRESTVARFTETLESLFPAVRDDAEEALGVAEAMMMFRRRLERAVSRASEIQPKPEKPRRRWPFSR
jgi:hypothetical protein